MKILKNNLKLFVGIIIGVLLSCVSVYALTMASKDVSYNNTQSGSQSSNVQGAVDELYEIVNSQKAELLWTNPTPTASAADGCMADQTISLDLTNYEAVMLLTVGDCRQSYNPSYGLSNTRYLVKGYSAELVFGVNASVGNSYPRIFTRQVTINNNGVTVGTGKYYSGGRDTVYTGNYGNIVKIYGIKKKLYD